MSSPNAHEQRPPPISKLSRLYRLEANDLVPRSATSAAGPAAYRPPLCPDGWVSRVRSETETELSECDA